MSKFITAAILAVIALLPHQVAAFDFPRDAHGNYREVPAPPSSSDFISEVWVEALVTWDDYGPYKDRIGDYCAGVRASYGKLVNPGTKYSCRREIADRNEIYLPALSFLHPDEYIFLPLTRQEAERHRKRTNQRERRLAKVEEKTRDHTESIESLRQHDAEQDQRLDGVEDGISELDEKVAESRERQSERKDLLAEIDRLRAHDGELRGENESLVVDLGAKEAENGDLRGRNEALQGQVTALETRVGELEADLAEAESAEPAQEPPAEVEPTPTVMAPIPSWWLLVPWWAWVSISAAFVAVLLWGVGRRNRGRDRDPVPAPSPEPPPETSSGGDDEATPPESTTEAEPADEGGDESGPASGQASTEIGTSRVPGLEAEMQRLHANVIDLQAQLEEKRHEILQIRGCAEGNQRRADELQERLKELQSGDEWTVGHVRTYVVDGEEHEVLLIRTIFVPQNGHGKIERFYYTDYLSGAAKRNGVAEEHIEEHLQAQSGKAARKARDS